MRVRIAGRLRAGSAGRPGIRLVLTGPAGLVGAGDAAPLTGRSRDAIDDVAAALEALGARGPFEVAESIEGVIEAVAESGIDPVALPSAAFALETALLDVVGRRLGIPAWRLLRDPGAPPPAPVPVNALAQTPSAAADVAVRAAAKGYGALKVKAAGAPVDRIHAGLSGARAVAPDLALRLDVAGAWGLEAARANLAALSDLGLAYVEDPVAPGDLPGLAGAPIPIAADAALDAEEGLDAVLAAGCVSVAVLKPAFVGGSLRTLAFAERARAAGLAVVVTHALDGPAGLAAAGDLALALDPPPLASGLAEHRGLWSWPGRMPSRAAGASVVPTEAPGLGLAP